MTQKLESDFQLGPNFVIHQLEDLGQTGQLTSLSLSFSSWKLGIMVLHGIVSRFS